MALRVSRSQVFITMTSLEKKGFIKTFDTENKHTRLMVWEKGKSRVQISMKPNGWVNIVEF